MDDIDVAAQSRTDPPPSPAGADIGSLLKPMTEGLSGLQREKTERTDAILSDTEQQLKTDEARVAKAYAATGVGPNELQPWDHAKQEEKYRTDPIEAFGSLGSVFGIVASAFTHAPMENALNASAAAIRATKEGNDEQRERAFRSYKENIDLVMKRHQMMHDSYADAVTLMKTNMAAGEARMSMEAARFGDKKTQFLLDNGMSEELFKMLESRNTAAKGMLDASNAITEDGMKKKIFEGQLKAIDENTQESQDPNKAQVAAAHKLAAWQTVFGADKQNPQQALMGRFFMEKPNATAEEAAEFAEKHGITHTYKASTDDQLRSMLRNDLGREPTAQEFIDAKRNVTGIEDRARAADEKNRITDERSAEIARHNQALEDINASKGDVAKMRAEETARHNQAMEKIKEKGPSGSRDLTIQRQNAKAAAEYEVKLRNDNPEMPEDEVQKKRAQKYSELQAASASPSGNQLDWMKGQVFRIGESQSVIGKAEALMKKHNAITGLGGKITRPGEALSNVFGSNATDRAQFESYISELKEWGPRLLNESKGKPLASEADKIDKIIRGLNWGDTTANTARNLKELRDTLERFKGNLDQRIQGGAGGEPSNKPESGGETPAWKRAPMVGPKAEIDSSEIAA